MHLVLRNVPEGQVTIFSLLQAAPLEEAVNVGTEIFKKLNEFVEDGGDARVVIEEFSRRGGAKTFLYLDSRLSVSLGAKRSLVGGKVYVRGL